MTVILRATPRDGSRMELCISRRESNFPVIPRIGDSVMPAGLEEEAEVINVVFHEQPVMVEIVLSGDTFTESALLENGWATYPTSLNIAPWVGVS